MMEKLKMSKKKQLKVTTTDINGLVVKNDDRYIVTDNITLNSMVVSTTVLYPNKETKGHSHEGQEEVYTFISGKGSMMIGTNFYNVEAGDVLLIPDGEFHQVTNESHDNLVFLCVFGGSRA